MRKRNKILGTLLALCMVLGVLTTCAGAEANNDVSFEINASQLPVGTTIKDGKMISVFAGSGEDMYLYALDGPESVCYNVSIARQDNLNLAGWCPNLVLGQSGAVFHTLPGVLYVLSASVTRPSSEEAYDLELMLTPQPMEGLTWVKANPFTDIPESETDVQAYVLKCSVLYVYANGWMTGTTSTTFSPDDYFTRSMLWTVMARMNDADTAGGSPWYEPARQWAMESGISDGTFPDRSASLQEVITMLYNQAGRPTATTNQNIDADGPVADWARDAMTWAYSECLIQRGNPAGAVTRAELAVILAKYAAVQ